MEALASLFPFLLIIVVFWFLLIRPQRRRAQEMAQLQNTVEVGSEVMLASGLYGTVSLLDADQPDLAWVEVAPGTTVKVARQAIVRVVTPENPIIDGPDS
ncbi:preprotein translocase subunit YajC [Nocardioides massiliensis]|uniref:Preprotein translocase subunit YajC n=1 Tax=Nocardioides massiliensis TaxID=1325935 RepID=A0ABT9NQW1_9ACTN|nr:preprotein translocase subunit YajC [Nocardioides massiliensis]MDP9822821.1 preprotein translocase subunit YajC [Nocardioides massiliensis]